MVAAGAISPTAFLAVDLTCRCLDIMLLEVEILLEVKVTCRRDVAVEDWRPEYNEANTCLRLQSPPAFSLTALVTQFPTRKSP